MKISDIYNLNKNQAELDFVNIDINRDTPLFIDPFFISKRKDVWSIEANRIIRDFFQKVIDLIMEGKNREAKELFSHLNEPNTNFLGMSKGNPRGKGVGEMNTNDIFESIINSRAVQTGQIQDIEDNVLFVNGFGKDKLSDMTTNIITNHLIKYTQDQCNLHNIPMSQNVPSGFYWERRTSQWEQNSTEMLVNNSKKILLIPKGIVSFCKDYTPDKYYNHFVLNFMQNENLRMNSSLVQQRKNGDKYVTKKDLKEKNPLSKDFLVDFTQRNPNILNDFKQATKTNSLNNSDISDENISDLCRYLVTKLQNIPSGTENATLFHRLVKGILELIFYPKLIYPTLEQEIHDGRKRIDLTFDNADNDSIFYRLSHNMDIPCQYIMVECKNYSSDIQNPELDQLSGRFSPNRGKFGFIVCRTIEDLESFLNRCKDTYRDGRGLIIPLVDDDLIDLLRNYDELNFDYIDKFLSDRIRKIMIN